MIFKRVDHVEIVPTDAERTIGRYENGSRLSTK